MRLWSLRRKRCQGYAALTLALPVVVVGGCARNKPSRFRVTVPKARRSAPVDGQLLVMLSKDPAREPRFQISSNAVATQQIFGIDIDGWAPGDPNVVDTAADGFPIERLSQVRAGEYTVQALLNGVRRILQSSGSLFRG